MIVLYSGMLHSYEKWPKYSYHHLDSQRKQSGEFIQYDLMYLTFKYKQNNTFMVHTQVDVKIIKKSKRILTTIKLGIMFTWNWGCNLGETERVSGAMEILCS